MKSLNIQTSFLSILKTRDPPFESANQGDSFKYRYVTSDEYLSGNIREKLAILDSHIEKNSV